MKTPMVTLDNGKDIWVGDMVDFKEAQVFVSEAQYDYRRFYMKRNNALADRSYVSYAEGYLVSDFI